MSKQGFTLIEVLVSMALILIAAFSIIYMQIASQKGNNLAGQISQATSLANKKKDNILNEQYGYYDSKHDYSEEELKNTDEPDYQNSTTFNNVTYSINWNVAEDSPIKGTKTIYVIVEWESYKESKEVIIPFIKSDTGMDS